MEVIGRNSSLLGHIYLNGLKPTTWGGQRGNLEMIDHRGRTALWKGIQFKSRKRGLLQWISPPRPYTCIGALSLGTRKLKTAVSGNIFKPFYSLAGIDEMEVFFDRHTIMSAFFLQGLRPWLCLSAVETEPSRELARA
jgi:hypothetical protein